MPGTTSASNSDVDAVNSESTSVPDESKTEEEQLTKSTDHFTRVRAPTAYDEVRCELRPSLGAPKLRRPALRSSGQLTVQHVAKFVRMQLALDAATNVSISCAGEDLNPSTTLRLIVRRVWPESEGHLVLHYSLQKKDTE